ncbi:hypothetical protein BC941DRAFT_444597 [Chlamydoabsidia padenii]|nr:hypothetical protein BC941DRAFT_444597 [Chlamydoabsidia padenii]
MLIHQDYASSLRATLKSHDITSVPFDPADPKNLNDPQYAELEEDEHRSKAQKLQKGRLLRALRHVQVHVFYPLAYTLIDQGWLSLEGVKELVVEINALQTEEEGQDSSSEMDL